MGVGLTFCFLPKVRAETLKLPQVAASSSGRPITSPAPMAKVAARPAAAAAAKAAASLDINILKQGLVVVEQAKRPLSVGLVLAGDGRVLTALSPLGNGNALTARYTNGAEKRLRMAASNRGLNLALLSPEDSRFNKGMRASRLAVDDPAAHARWLRGNQAFVTSLSTPGTLRRETLTGGDGYTLRDVFTVGFVARPVDLGSVLVDANGDVLAIISQACQPHPDGDCRPVATAIPVSMVKEFLRNVPEGSVMPAPWIGLQVAEADAGALKAVRISSVDARGPVAALGLRAGRDLATADLLVAIDGVAVTSTRAFEELLRRRTVGERVRLLIYSEGHYREATTVLGHEPEHLADTSGVKTTDVGY